MRPGAGPCYARQHAAARGAVTEDPMSYSCFEVENAGKVAHVKLKRAAELNTMTPAFWT